MEATSHNELGEVSNTSDVPPQNAPDSHGRQNHDRHDPEAEHQHMLWGLNRLDMARREAHQQCQRAERDASEVPWQDGQAGPETKCEEIFMGFEKEGREKTVEDREREERERKLTRDRKAKKSQRVAVEPDNHRNRAY